MGAQGTLAKDRSMSDALIAAGMVLLIVALMVVLTWKDEE